ncbi:two-component hyrid sensor and regulator [Bordetella ansorpii]|uniref:histidine kinase n=1 Tax=Bordetella ansorpii TaxID=288768 RepID=A0A157PMM2_9BORD|nr:response regulator [Bordetella ansorpii]SAI34781.1 two-component hyrid sensor and regulator [Bordetella ansorpii]
MSVLILEDDDLDAELILYRLGEALPGVAVQRASNRKSYEARLRLGGITLVVSDFSLPDIDGWAAQRMAAELAPDAPFIFVSGIIGEEVGVKAMKEGATDYVLKERLERLGAAARRALLEAEDRRARKCAEEALRDSEERFRTLSDSAPALIWETDEQGEMIFTNRYFEDLFGQPPGAMLGQGWQQAIDGRDLPLVLDLMQRATRERREFQMEMRVLDRRGDLRWLHCKGVPRMDRSGRFLGLLGTNVDITDARRARDELEHMVAARTAELLRTNERLLQEMQQRADAESAARSAEEQLRQAQKMEAFGQLTGGVAHDFNNFLTVILGNLETLERTLTHAPGRTATALAHAKLGAQRAAALTQRLLSFARRQPLQPRRIDLNGLISDTIEILSRTLGEHVEVRTELSADLWDTLTDPHMLESALVNLAVNARDAMPEGGVISIRTGNAEIGIGHAEADGLLPGQYVRISLGDTGTGIPPELLGKVFEPFFTTKDIGVGTGLGLSQVYGFVKQSGGHVRIDSTLGTGTTVHLYLPRQNTAGLPEAEPLHDGQARQARPGEVVLVVEDNTGVRLHSTRILQDLGYVVHEASDGPEALEQIERHPDISLVFTDVGLPKGMNGRELAEAARALRPGLPVLYTSGYAEGALTHGGQLPPGVDLLPKPFSFVDLANRIRDILDRQAPESASEAPSRILLVEDEDLIRMLALEGLEDLGYDVAEAATGGEALRLLEAEPGAFEGAIVDMGLPDMKGEDLLRTLAQRYPGLAIVIASGAHVSASELPPHARLASVQKPYQFAQLGDALRGLGVGAVSQG